MSERIDIRKRLGLELQRSIHKRLIEEHPLYQLFWECTLRCNLHCQHCGSDCKTSASTPDMPLDDFLHVLDSISRQYDPHKVFVIITGGEPLMRQDLELCGRKIYDKGFPWGMVTNGFALTGERLRGLVEAGLHTVSISLDGMEEAHNWMRGSQESFQRVSEAIDLMVNEKSILFDVVTCVTEKNIDQLDNLRDFLVHKGVRRWRLLTVFPVGRGATNRHLQLSHAQFRQLMEFIKKSNIAQKHTPSGQATGKDIQIEYGCEGFLGNYEFDVRNDAFFCKAGITVGSVLADGSIAACASIRSDYNQGNIYCDDFLEVWENRYSVYRERKWMKQGECGECKVWRYCHGGALHLRDDKGNMLACNYLRINKN